MSLTVQNIVNDLNLEVLNGDKALSRVIDSDLLARPGVELAGFYDFYDPRRIVLIGSKEASFLKVLSPDIQRSRLEEIFKKKQKVRNFGSVRS